MIRFLFPTPRLNSMVAASLSPCSSPRVWWNPQALSFAASRCFRHSAPGLPNAFSSSTPSYPIAESAVSVPGMSVASCFRTHQSCVPIGRRFQAAPARAGNMRAAAAALPPSFRMSRRVGFWCMACVLSVAGILRSACGSGQAAGA